MNILGKRSDLLFSRKSDRKKEKSTVSFTHMQNIICSQTQLDGIAHEQTIICRQLFAGQVVGSRPMKRKKNLLRMIRGLTFLEFNLLTASCSVITRSPLPETIFSRSESISLIISGSVRSNCTTASNSSIFEVEESPERPSVYDPWVVQYWKQTRQSWARFDIIFAGKRWLLLVDPGSAASSNKLNKKTTRH